MSLLALTNVQARHGLLQAVRGVSLSLDKGETLALVGANGAGKTTLLRAIAGAHKLSGGSIALNSVDVGALPAYARAARGIALTPEGRRLFLRMSVEENLLLAKAAGRKGAFDVDAIMTMFPNLKARRKSLAGSLSGGEQQATAIGRALMTNPDVLLLDEVSLGLAPIVVERLYGQLEALKGSGLAIILVEQDLKRAMGAATRIACMLEGEIVLQGKAGELTREAIMRAYFGLRSGGQAA
jgi:branched-chain amino acid transport system ATP-binding protein